MPRGWFGPRLTARKNERNRALCAAFWAGGTGTELAAQYGISRARVYQIVARYTEGGETQCHPTTPGDRRPT